MITIPAKGSLPRLNLGQAQLECPATRGRRALIALLSIRSRPKAVSVQIRIAPVRARSPGQLAGSR